MPLSGPERRYEYTVITRENAADCHADPTWFKNHPDWNVLLRSNYKWPGRKTWICAGGVAVDEAKESLESALLELIFVGERTVTVLDNETSVVMPVVLIGEESATIIKD